MKVNDKYVLDFKVDKLTDSILNVVTGNSFQTEVSLINSGDLKNIESSKKWNFDWKKEYNDNSKEVYKLTIVNNPNVIQGLICLSIKVDHIQVLLLESAYFNIGSDKVYFGVPGNLVAYACKLSFQKGFDGYVAFIAKSNLIKHYEKSLGAIHVKNQRMILDKFASEKLVKKYFK